MGIAMMAFLSIYERYKGVYLVESQMNEWEAQRLKERLVEVDQDSVDGGGGDGGTSSTLNRTFLVSDETVSDGDQLTSAPRLWLFDVQDGSYEHIDSYGDDEVEATFTILTSELQSYSGGSWDFTLRMYLKTYPNVEVEIYAYNHQTGRFDLIDSFTRGEGPDASQWFEWSRDLQWGTYVSNENATIKISVERYMGGGKFHVRIDRMVLEGTYSTSESLTSTRYNVTDGDPSLSPTELNSLKVRDGSYLEILGDTQQTFIISGLPTDATYRSISAYITLATPLWTEYNVDIYAYDFANDAWVLTNSTSLSSDDDLRIRVPLSTDYISSGGQVKLKISTDRITGSYLYVDEVAVDAITVQGGGGGGGEGGSLIIRNDSPFTSRIVRIWYIGSDSIYVYDPPTPIALQPGETMDLADYHSLSGITLVKVVTDFGNVFSFVP